jgi:hypothetical protein
MSGVLGNDQNGSYVHSISRAHPLKAPGGVPIQALAPLLGEYSQEIILGDYSQDA